eukprot:9544770-Ditylum_brightwellii.AAC.1
MLVYIDNIFLYTKSSFEHHVKCPQGVLEVICDNNLHMHMEKTFLANTLVDYLGYTITTKGSMPQTNKILPVLALKEPSNLKQLHGFLGLGNYYKKLWYHHSETLEPLTRLTSTKHKFIWGHEQAAAFKAIKQTMACKILLHFPDFTKTFGVYDNASDYQLGGIISQDDWLIEFYSRKLNSAQKNYTTMEKDLLSIMETTEFHCNILLGFKLCFHSNHKNLSFENFCSEHVHRWCLLLEDYDYKFIYTP